MPAPPPGGLIAEAVRLRTTDLSAQGLSCQLLCRPSAQAAVGEAYRHSLPRLLFEKR